MTLPTTFIGEFLADLDGFPFFYVRFTGQASNSPQTGINVKAAGTRNLNAENIRALCCNDLMALFVDGFEELLGGVGYDWARASCAIGAAAAWLLSDPTVRTWTRLALYVAALAVVVGVAWALGASTQPAPAPVFVHTGH